MSYGYASSEPNLTVTINTKAIAALEKLAKQLGYTQSRGATAGRGSLSALLNALGQAAATAGAASTVRRMRWLKNAQVGAGHKTSKRLLLEDESITALREVAAKLGYIAPTGIHVGQGSINALVNTLASAAQNELASVEKSMTWLRLK